MDNMFKLRVVRIYAISVQNAFLQYSIGCELYKIVTLGHFLHHPKLLRRF